MSEREFELYLSLLSRFLRLKPAQRDEIADELRDHLEQRLEELAARGVPRDEAIRSALEEFGDAAALANHFTHVSHICKRRLVMRRTLASIAALAVLVLLATAFWPAAVPPMPAPAFIIAQQPGPAARFSPMGGSAIPPAAQDADRAAVEAKLAKRIDNLHFVEASLQDALDFLSEATEIDILVDRQTLANEGVSVDAPVQLVVSRTRVTARTALDLLLEPYHLSYTIREGLIQITTANLANEIKVYNVRDLLTDFGGPMAGSPGMAGPMAGGMSPPRMMGGASAMAPSGAEAGHVAGMPGGGLGGVVGGGVGYANYQTASLAEVIATTIAPDSWNIGGGPGSITEYNGLLVVKNGQAVHGKIRQLLDMMRTASSTPVR